MSEWFSKTYDEPRAFSLYILYESGDDSVLNELLENLCPLIRRCFRMEVNKDALGDRGNLESDALEAVYELLRDQDIPTHHSRVFTRYVSTVIIRTFRDSLVKLRQQTFDLWQVAQTYPGARLVTSYDVEADIYREQIHRELRKVVRSRIRFQGADRDACVYIIDCELGYKELPSLTVRRKVGLPNARCKYLIRYVNVLIRAALWEFGEREHKDGPLSPDWSPSRGVLRPSSELW